MPSVDLSRNSSGLCVRDVTDFVTLLLSSGGLARDFVGDYIKRHPNCTNESVVQVWDSSVRGAGHNPYGVGIFLERQYVANVRRSFFGSDKGKGTPSMTGVPRVQNLSLHHQNQ
eukprot:scaffold186031_cov23-Tisochrysis_lutea.AAC.1